MTNSLNSAASLNDDQKTIVNDLKKQLLEYPDIEEQL